MSHSFTLSDKTIAFLKEPKKLLIHGQWVAPLNKQYFAAINPSNNQEISQIPLAESSDVDHAVDSANKSFENHWKTVSAVEKASLMFRLADLIERDQQTLMELETLDNGKPLSKAQYDIDACIHHFRYYAGWATKIEGATHPVSKDALVYTQKEPLGVVGLIVPWNFPLMIASWKLAPALACGNCCVLKPSEKTSLSALYLGKLIQGAGFPKGVVNIITGDGDPTGIALVRHQQIDKISFTGSTKTGKFISQQNAHSTLKRVSLELGGKSPNVIFSDADIEKVTQSLHWSSFYNTGQECTLGSRVFIQKTIFDQVIDQLIKQSKKLSIGHGLENPDLGPLIDQGQFKRVMDYIRSGQNEGAELICGGHRLNDKHLKDGYFMGPTIFSHQNDRLKIVNEEIFGPVVVVSSFDSYDQVIQRANDSPYGLAAGVWTQSHSKALQFANDVKAGTVWINGWDQFSPAVPFGGFKDSGIGKEMGKSAIDLYTQEKTVWLNY